MTPLRDNELKDMLKNLDGQLRMEPSRHGQLRDRILMESEKAGEPKRKRKLGTSRMRIRLAAAAAMLLLLGTSPFYSPAMASFAERILPLIIAPSESAGDSLSEKIMQAAEESGYPVSAVGITPDPFTVQLAFTKEEMSLSEMEEAVEPAIHELLAEEGIDQYQLDLTVMQEGEDPPSDTSRGEINVEPLISEAFSAYGYPDLAGQPTYSIKEGKLFNTLEVNMPDQVKEIEEIKEYLLANIEKEKWNIQKVELRYFNAAHRSQEDRWAFVSSDIFEAMEGKAIYGTTGLSYKVEEGVTHVQIKTALPKQPDPQLLKEISTAIRVYLESNEIKSTIQEDDYRIQLLSKEKTILLEVTNAAK
ncbi:hypothetical protein [Planomicrobium sp. CPCC 101110]|uniref:hypothetical protein n=1 Tax=Planomicrobium sp. CPCC 101110 TaxID=2599619 RepID=UPI0011B67AFA|nr:hypothetical protein [Planomicrobium sp. CPCC 101110]TWT27225.1 hypothetical protein FQV30_01525 [Planomicrobium sp. CPCC 101110]